MATPDEQKNVWIFCKKLRPIYLVLRHTGRMRDDNVLLEVYFVGAASLVSSVFVSSGFAFTINFTFLLPV